MLLLVDDIVLIAGQSSWSEETTVHLSFLQRRGSCSQAGSNGVVIDLVRTFVCVHAPCGVRGCVYVQLQQISGTSVLELNVFRRLFEKRCVWKPNHLSPLETM